jgi:hypothetical protein
MSFGILKKKVLGRALDYAFRFEMILDREVGEPSSAAFDFFIGQTI